MYNPGLFQREGGMIHRGLFPRGVLPGKFVDSLVTGTVPVSGVPQVHDKWLNIEMI
jgi:hypothetical protein